MDREDRFARSASQPVTRDDDDAAARFVHELATKPPTKDVASIKAASDVYEANIENRTQQTDKPRQRADVR